MTEMVEPFKSVEEHKKNKLFVMCNNRYFTSCFHPIFVFLFLKCSSANPESALAGLDGTKMALNNRDRIFFGPGEAGDEKILK